MLCASHVTSDYVNSAPHNPVTASALVSDNLKVPLICVVPIMMACLLKPKHVAMVKNICCV